MTRRLNYRSSHTKIHLMRSRSLSTYVCAFFVIIAALAAARLRAAEPKTELLWPEGAPGAKGETPHDKPTLIIYLPEKEKATGTGIVVCPGGGYGGLAMGHEGHDIGKWLNSLGIAAFICDYRHSGKGYKHPAPLDDAQRAIRTARARATEFNIKPNRIGVLGFSAGGHLASTAATHFEAERPDEKDTIQKQSSRPDFAVLCYPVIVFDADYTHKGSQHNLIGQDAAPDLVQSLSNEKQVTANTPPTFLWHTTEDKVVPPENSVQFYLACVKHKVRAELHIYEKGQHGIGLGTKHPGADQWPKQFELWLAGLKLGE
jgi:acetyl esterase/lipase